MFATLRHVSLPVVAQASGSLLIVGGVWLLWSLPWAMIVAGVGSLTAGALAEARGG